MLWILKNVFGVKKKNNNSKHILREKQISIAKVCDTFTLAELICLPMYFILEQRFKTLGPRIHLIVKPGMLRNIQGIRDNHCQWLKKGWERLF